MVSADTLHVCLISFLFCLTPTIVLLLLDIQWEFLSWIPFKAHLVKQRAIGGCHDYLLNLLTTFYIFLHLLDVWLFLICFSNTQEVYFSVEDRIHYGIMKAGNDQRDNCRAERSYRGMVPKGVLCQPHAVVASWVCCFRSVDEHNCVCEIAEFMEQQIHMAQHLFLNLFACTCMCLCSCHSVM